MLRLTSSRLEMQALQQPLLLVHSQSSDSHSWNSKWALSREFWELTLTLVQ